MNYEVQQARQRSLTGASRAFLFFAPMHLSQLVPAPLRELVGRKSAGTSLSASRLPTPGQSGLQWRIGNLIFGGWDPRRPDFGRIIGDPTKNSAVWACLNWIVTSWPQAVPTVVAGTGESEKLVPDHPLPLLLSQPSADYDGRWLMQALISDWYGAGRGNAYAYVVILDGEPAELQYLPASCMKPKWDRGELVYEYRCDGKPIVLRPSEGRYVLHFRNGIDPDNILLGRDPLQSVQAEVATDNVACEYQYKLLANGAVPPYVIGPDAKDSDGMSASISNGEAQQIKAVAVENGQNGMPMVMTTGFRLQQTGVSPKDLVMGETQRKSEERIAAAFGLPPVVAGLGAGLDRSTFNNYEEARQAAWEDCVIPLQDAFASEVTRTLVPLFDGLLSGNRLKFDRSNVGALSENKSAIAADVAKLYAAGVIDRWEAKTRLGIKPDESDKEVYATSGQVPGEQPPVPEAPASAPKKGYPLPFEPAPASGAEWKNVGPVSDSSELDAAIKKFRRDLQSREVSAVAGVQDALKVAEDAVQARLDALLVDVEALPDGEPSEAWLLRQERYRDLLTQIEQAYQSYVESAAPGLEEAQRGYVRTAASHAETLTAAALGPAPEGVVLRWNALPKAALESLVGYASDGSPLRKLLEELGPDTAKQVREALVVGVATGQNPRDTARAMREGAGAKLAISRARAEAIARTETLRAAREGARQSFAANGDIVDGWIWTATRDARTCASCWAMHGTEYALTESLDDHVNGRCVATPKTKSWAEITGDDSLPDTRPTITPGVEVFDTLDAARQRGILGQSLYDAWSAGEVSLSDCSEREYDARWGTQRRQATLAEARANAQRRKADS